MTAEPRRRVVVVGWDGVDAELVDRLASEGSLPTLASLRREGSVVAIRGLPGLGDDGSWATFATGVEPGVHGRFHYFLPAPGSYEDRYRDRTTMDRRPFWALLDDHGVRVRALDVPKSPLTDGRSSTEITDWMIHGPDGPRPVSWPPGAIDDEEGLDRAALFDCDAPKVDAPARAAHLRAIEDRLARRSAVVERWLRHDDWDLLLAVYAEGHCAGHHFRSSPADPRGDEVVRDIVVRLDRELERVVAEVGDDAAVVVFGLVGMAEATAAGDVIELALERLGPMVFPGTPAVDPALTGAAGARRHLRRLGARLPRRLRRMLGSRWPAPPPDPKGRAALVAYPLPFDAMATPIRLNVAGREPSGIVAPDDVDAVCRRVQEELLALVDPVDGRRICAEIVRVKDRYPGPHEGDFADLLACWDDRPHRAATSPTLGRIDALPPPRRPGDHRGGGWAVVRAPGERGAVVPPVVDVVDLPVTIASLCGVDLDELPGRSFVEVTGG